MFRRIAAAVAATLLLSVALSGCTDPAPGPTPTPTGFEDQDAAFAAAEATYRAYVDALNQVDLSNPETFEDVYQWTTGTANDEERKSLTGMHAEGWAMSGETRIVDFMGEIYSPKQEPIVVAVACSDISDVDVVDAAGESQVSPDRPDGYQLRLSFAREPSSKFGVRISSSVAEENDKCG
jgi:hypothetical protein